MVKKKRRFRVGRFIICIFAMVAVIFLSDCIRRYLNEKNDKYSSVSIQLKIQGKAPKRTVKINTEPETEKNNNEYNNTFTELEIDYSQLFSGELVEVNSQKPYVSPEMTPTVNLVSYRNDYYTLINETDPVILNTAAADALNLMMEDYYKSTGQTNFLVYGTTDTYTGEGSFCPYSFPESITGNTIDIAVNVGSSVLTYDGCDVEKWLVENCHRYGYIVRFPKNKSEKTGYTYCPWHLRYVGKVHSAVMNELGCCLEEYLDLLRKYTYDHPLYYNLDGIMYYIYTVKSAGQKTTARVPVQSQYTISGDNTGSFIITSLKF
ncbi:MAG: D-alanyl-D-alanine carboxypeptidase family protein [Prevotella sp.]|nr:D-alanyl-D-alanine carboxypeptidase family protein [Alistipes senegalensis]MCM1357908.1 D-alanyl-D-alanine carboxypeptidase family protein [Prevotella sp.]MCM1473366.1 D-alanyl-D-alanine carboxypeptidase family protein [Muribaculaceae bacterium]